MTEIQSTNGMHSACGWGCSDSLGGTKCLAAKLYSRFLFLSFLILLPMWFQFAVYPD
uniref:Uncharacterized protein n=1 Tax=Anguilla anguilla TaxID=7936 RepID=A0A0E9WP87_ANGAN